ncbi:calmodulin binding protein, putative [Ricinus communis]|uniref:Calmodulin binding protein, putative n=1 Tax=Ricinus communis TaxID=3988 RepID=B9SFA7_RICCO|nr:calmodulin binding protein, putative [Ricinus communis]
MQTRFMERSSSMAREKRGLDSSSGDEGQPDKKRPALASVIVEALKVDSLQKLCSSLEPILRRVVSEEVERALAKLGSAKLTGRSSPKCIGGPDGRNLQLHFRSRLSLPLFTGGKVEGEQGAAVHIVLIDANTGHVVTSGPESSVKLDVIVLEGDFNNEDDDNWTPEEFDSHVVKEREGKRPLLTGDLQVTLKEGVYVDGLVKKAYENWMHVIEYDGKTLLDFKQNENIVASQTDNPICQEDFLNSYDHQVTLPTLSVPVPPEQPAMDSGPTVGGYNNNMAARFSMQAQNENINTPFQFDAASMPLQNPLPSTSQQNQFSRSDSLLALAPPQSSTSSFQGVCTPNVTSYRGSEDFFPEEDLRVRSNEMLENDDMQHLLRIFNMGGQGLSSLNMGEDGYPYPSSYVPAPSPNYSFGDDQSRSSGKAVIGWLKLKAALRWGIFVRKRAAERRAQLIELDDP